MSKDGFSPPLFSLGFRAFFALAGLFALILIALWAAIFKGSVDLDNYFPDSFWHGHEMLLGYSVAVIAGLILTAVKNWTGINALKDQKLMNLCLLWVYGRVVPFYSELLPDTLIALIDFMFIPILAYYVAKPLIKTHESFKLFFVFILLLLAAGNAMIHAEILGYCNNSAILGLELVVGVIVLMIVLIAGQFYPVIKQRGLKGAIIINNPVLDQTIVISTALMFLLMVLDAGGFLLAVVALIAFLSNVYRAISWYEQRIWYVPLIWVLFFGYFWVILGFLFVALSAFQWISQSAAIHAFTVGGIGVLTIGMMARISLGQTGKALRSSNTMAIAFIMINLAALFTAIFPAILPVWYSQFLLISIYCWLAAFSLFVFTYIPVFLTLNEE